MIGQVDNDRELLEAVLERDNLSEKALIAFSNMLDGLSFGRPLSAEQRAWATAALEGQQYVPSEKYENLVSSGKVPRGREVELMVTDKPLKPPGIK